MQNKSSQTYSGTSLSQRICTVQTCPPRLRNTTMILNQHTVLFREFARDKSDVRLRATTNNVLFVSNSQPNEISFISTTVSLPTSGTIKYDADYHAYKQHVSMEYVRKC